MRTHTYPNSNRDAIKNCITGLFSTKETMQYCTLINNKKCEIIQLYKKQFPLVLAQSNETKTTQVLPFPTKPNKQTNTVQM
jgi:phosphoribosylanthranilate isomerase